MPPRDEVAPPAADFIPPAAEKPMRPVRMPTADEMPPIVREQMRAAPAAAPRAPENPVEKKRTSLMEKLQSIGFTRRGEADTPAPAPVAPRAAPPLQPARPVAQAPRMPAAPAPQMRREPAGLDMHGRPAAQQPRAEEDHLDIPAFLRRQAN